MTSQTNAIAPCPTCGTKDSMRVYSPICADGWHQNHEHPKDLCFHMNGTWDNNGNIYFPCNQPRSAHVVDATTGEKPHRFVEGWDNSEPPQPVGEQACVCGHIEFAHGNGPNNNECFCDNCEPPARGYRPQEPVVAHEEHGEDECWFVWGRQITGTPPSSTQNSRTAPFRCASASRSATAIFGAKFRRWTRTRLPS